MVLKRRGLSMKRSMPKDERGERVAEVHACTSAAEANQYLALGPEWDLWEVIPVDSGTDEDGDDPMSLKFIVVRWESAADRARTASRDQRATRTTARGQT